jgi:hypothetical protein
MRQSRIRYLVGRWPLVATALASYLAFVLASTASRKAGLGATWAFIIIWPYPFLLALQHWMEGNWWLGYGVGLVVVASSAALCQRLAGVGKPTGILAWWIGLVIMVSSLTVVQYSAQGYAHARGFPTGE